MFKYKFYEFFNEENTVLTIQFDYSKFLIGGFFTESSLINLCSFINSKLIEKSNIIKKINWNFFPFNINIRQESENNEILSLKEIFSDLKVIIIPNFKSIFGYILIYKLLLENETFFQINKEILNKIMIYSTEPIVQFAHSYLNEFYSSFNSILMKYTTDNKIVNMNNNKEISSVLYIKEQMKEYPEIKPVLKLLKRYFYTKKMNSSFEGGLSSYNLFLLILSFAKYQKIFNSNQNKAINLGFFLVQFLEFFGKFFDFRNYLININSPFIYELIDNNIYKI